MALVLDLISGFTIGNLARAGEAGVYLERFTTVLL